MPTLNTLLYLKSIRKVGNPGAQPAIECALKIVMLLGLQDVTFEFGARVIVKDATWHIQPNERIGLIGYNGTGKSTLLKVFTGEYLPSAGSVEKAKTLPLDFFTRTF